MGKPIHIVYGIHGGPAVAIFAAKQAALDWVSANPGRTLRVEEVEDTILAIKCDSDTYVDPAVRDLAMVLVFHCDSATGTLTAQSASEPRTRDTPEKTDTGDTNTLNSDASTPEPASVPDYAPYPSTDVDLVESHTGASRADAARALIKARGDIVNAIMSLET